MSYTRTTRNVYKCRCDVCAFEWETATMPTMCKSRPCRSKAWNGQDRRRGTFKRTRVQKASSK